MRGGHQNAPDSDEQLTSASGGELPRRKLPRLLILDDHRELREALRKYFEICGYAVMAAGSFDTALDAASRQPPDVAICDWQIDGPRNGVEVARELQHRFGSKIIFVSGASMRDLHRESRDLSVTAYFAKPVAPDRIAAAIKTGD